MKYTILIIAALLFVFSSFGQVSYPISTYTSTPDAFRYLLLSNQQIEDNDTINEEIIDLVTPMVTDSVLGRREPHHHLFLLGWMIHTFAGYAWRPVEPVKLKYVGTVRGDSRSGRERYTEYDICFNLYFHLHKYLFESFKAFDMQRKIHRQDFVSKMRHPGRKHRRKYVGQPFVRDSSNVDMSVYRLHCEVTPARPYRYMLNNVFFPVERGMDVEHHPNFLSSHPSMGFYGASCLDCNHDCHPEIHPYEWIWWMNLHNGTEKDKSWLLGLFKEGSNRFPGWSENPKTGKIAVPFAFDVKDKAAKDRTITIEHLVFGQMIDSNLAMLHLPATLIGGNQHVVDVNFGEGTNRVPIHIIFSDPITSDGLKYWFTDVNWDEQNHILSGFFHVATSVRDLYTTRVTFSGQ